MTIKERLSNGDVMWQTERGEGLLRVLAPHVVCISIKGHSSMELVPLFTGEIERRIQRGIRVDWFGDYSAMTSYDSAARVALTDFTHKHTEGLNRVVILVQSRLVAMRVSVANLAVGGKIEAFADRRKWQHALDLAVGRPVDGNAPWQHTG